MKKVLSVLVSLLIVAGLVAVLKGYVNFGQRNVVVVCGSEFQTVMQELAQRFQRNTPGILVEVRIQGSQDMINKYIDDKNDFVPTILMPSSRELLMELDTRWKAQDSAEAFFEAPRALASTIMVGVAWPERGKVLFPEGKFQWSRVEEAMTSGNWKGLNAPPEWGSFDFVTTDPTRSNSGQVTLSLWLQSKLGNGLTLPGLSSPEALALISLVKKSVYQPPRSTDILLQEFITRGPNDADIATVYESSALGRWQQSGASTGRPYQVYYLDPTVETVAAGAIVRRGVADSLAKAGSQFLEFLSQPEAQAVFAQYGFRPVNTAVDINTSPGSVWSQGIPGALSNPGVQRLPPPTAEISAEINKLWNRAG